MSEMDETLPAFAGALIGYRRDGQPIYLAAGGAPEDDTDVDEDASETEADSTDDGGEEIDWKAKYEAQKAFNRKLEQRQRNAAAKAKPASKPATKAAAEPEDDEPDDRDERLTAAEKEAAGARAELRIERLLNRQGYDAEQLMDSNKFLAAINGLDVDSDTPWEEFDELVLELAAKHGKKQQGRRVGRQGADVSGGQTGRQRPQGLAAAISARMQGAK